VLILKKILKKLKKYLRMRKVAFVNSTLTWGGGEKWHLENAKGLKERGYDVNIICNSESELFKRAGKLDIKTTKFKSNKLSFLNPIKLSKAKNILSNFDTVILNSPQDLKIFGKSKAKNIKLVYRRGSAIPIKNNSLNSLLLNEKVDLIIANSEATKSTILENGVLKNPDKILVIPNGIKINPKLNRKDITEPIVLGNLGRMVDQKNQVNLIEIAKILKDKGLDYKLLIGGSGKLWSEIHKIALEYNLIDNVEFLGEIDDIDWFYNQIDIFLLTSKWEGFGYVIAESFNFGKPVIAYDISSNPELIKNDDNGCLVKPFDKNAFADKIIELAQNKEKIYSLGENAFTFIKENRSFEKSLEKLIKII
jgi:glycosyltransferase involved in cell wall biosynthesis